MKAPSNKIKYTARDCVKKIPKALRDRQRRINKGYTVWKTCPEEPEEF